MATMFPALMGTNGEARAILDVAGKRWDQGARPTQQTGGPRNTALPAPIRYNPAALDGLGKPAEDPATYATVTRPSQTAPTWDGAVRAAWTDETSLTMLGIIPDDGVKDRAAQTLGRGQNATYAVEFTTDATEVGIVLRKRGAFAVVRLWVDGNPHPQYVAGPNPGDSTTPAVPTDFTIKVTFPTTKTRTIRADLRFADFVGIDRPAGTTLTATPRPETRVLVLGDSFVEAPNAEGQPDTWLIDQFGWLLGPLLGVEVMHHGFGGSGWRAQAPDRHYAAPARREKHAQVRPDYAVPFGSQNDNGTTYEQVLPYAKDLLTSLAEYARIFVVGPSHMGGDPLDSALARIATEPTNGPRVFGYTSPVRWTDLDTSGWYLEAHLTWAGNVAYAKRIAKEFAAAHANAFPNAI